MATSANDAERKGGPQRVDFWVSGKPLRSQNRVKEDGGAGRPPKSPRFRRRAGGTSRETLVLRVVKREGGSKERVANFFASCGRGDARPKLPS